jgi:hypothetical protein
MMKNLVLFIMLCSMVALGAPVTTGTLAREMVDLERLAETPAPFYKVVQFSSYDHRSATPGGPEWFANADGFGKEPVPNFEAVLKAPPEKDGVGEYLVCDIQGPGALVRQWTARINGTIRVYLDGSETPVFDGPAEQFFMRPYDAYKDAMGFEAGILESTFYQRNAAYCPIPFAQRCRVVWIGKLNTTHFYQLEARIYDKDAKVQSFSPSDLKTFTDDIVGAVRGLAQPDVIPEGAAASNTVALAPGQLMEAVNIEGPSAVRLLRVRVEADNPTLALRQTIMHVQADGYPWGHVQSPVGDFFGAAPGVNPYVSTPFTVEADGTMTSRFVMPCKNNLRIEFENLGEQNVRVRAEIIHAPYAWDDERSMHFRARWSIDHGLVGDGARVQDIPFLIANGGGVFVGAVSYVLNPNDVPSSGGSWWGEGDEKIFVDDDTQPSLFGTGSEDYYNYAWSARDIFIYPYCGQPVNTGPANRGFVTNYRWHILDPLPFRYRMSFYMELYPHERNEGMAYGRIGYHYARPGVMDNHLPITREDVRPQVLPPWSPAARGGARNSVFFEAEDCVDPSLKNNVAAGDLWSGGKRYHWQPKQIGETLALNFEVPESRNYNIRIAAALDPKSGRVSVLLDGKAINLGGKKGVLDLYQPYRTLLRCLGGASHKFEKGKHTLTLRYEGSLEDIAVPHIGLDFLWLRKD